MKKKQSTVNTIIVIIGLTFFAKAIGFIRDAKIGGILGAGVDSDAYFSALNITIIFFSNIAAGIGASLIPTIVNLINREKEEANKKINNVINTMLLLSAIITVIGIIAAPILVNVFAKGYTGAKYALTVKITAIMMPSLIFICLTYIFVAFLQANSSFVIPSIISLPANIIMLMFMYIGFNRYGIIGLTIVTVLGWALQWIIQMPSAIKHNYRYKFYLDFKDSDLRHFLKIIVPIIFVSAVYQINIIIDNMFSASFGDGKVTQVYYANILYAAFVTTTVLGVTSVMFPKFSKALTRDGTKDFYSQVTGVVRGLSLVLIPMGVGVAILAEPVIRLVFERGEFDSIAAGGAAQVLAVYSVAMVAYGIIDVLNKGFYALSNTKAPVITGVIIIVSNIILTIILEKIGYIGIPIATSLAFLIGAIVQIIFFHNEENDFIRKVLPTIIKSFIAVALMGGAVYVTKGVVSRIDIQNISIKYSAIIFTSMAVGIVVYGVSLLILKEEILCSYISSFTSKIRRKQ
jgi:putative peptidoglycan lipid II flippase